MNFFVHYWRKTEKNFYVIDGNNFTNQEEFDEELNRVFFAGTKPKGHAFTEIVYGLCHVIPNGFTLIWKNSKVSRSIFGYEATISFWENALYLQTKGLSGEVLLQQDQESALGTLTHNKKAVEGWVASKQRTYQYIQKRIDNARRHKGKTIFDELMIDPIKRCPQINLQLE